MSKKVKGVAIMKASVLLATHNFKHQYTEAVHIRFGREKAFQ